MYETEIAAGVAVLDARRPDWRERLDVDRLYLGDVTRCVVGQTFHVERGDDYYASRHNWFDTLADVAGLPYDGELEQRQRLTDWACTHGFDTQRVGTTYDDLTVAWKTYLAGEGHRV